MKIFILREIQIILALEILSLQDIQLHSYKWVYCAIECFVYRCIFLQLCGEVAVANACSCIIETGFHKELPRATVWGTSYLSNSLKCCNLQTQTSYTYQCDQLLIAPEIRRQSVSILVRYGVIPLGQSDRLWHL